MRQTNAIINIDPMRLNCSSAPMYARVGASFSAALYGVPDDILSVAVRICPDAGHGGFYDFPAARADSGDWRVRIPGVAFRSAGSGWYEVRAADAEGEATALARGRLLVFQFSAGTALAIDSRRRVVTVLPDESGAMHAIFAVRDDAGEWTLVIGDVDDTATVGARTQTLAAASAGDGEAVAISTDGETVIIDDLEAP